MLVLHIYLLLLVMLPSYSHGKGLKHNITLNITINENKVVQKFDYYIQENIKEDDNLISFEKDKPIFGSNNQQVSPDDKPLELFKNGKLVKDYIDQNYENVTQFTSPMETGTKDFNNPDTTSMASVTWFNMSSQSVSNNPSTTEILENDTFNNIVTKHPETKFRAQSVPIKKSGFKELLKKTAKNSKKRHIKKIPKTSSIKFLRKILNTIKIDGTMEPYSFEVNGDQYYAIRGRNNYNIYKFNTMKVLLLKQLQNHDFCRLLKDIFVCSKTGSESLVLIYKLKTDKKSFQLHLLQELERSSSDIELWFQENKMHMLIVMKSLSELYEMEDGKFKKKRVFQSTSIKVHHFQLDENNYIVFPNYGNLEGFTTIQKFDQGKYVNIKELSSPSPSDIKSIKINNKESLLVLLNNCHNLPDKCNSTVYLINNEDIKKIQNIMIPSATQCILEKNGDDIFLGIISMVNGVHIYRYNNGFFKNLDVLEDLREPGITGISYLPILNVLAITSSDAPPTFYKIIITSTHNFKKLRDLRYKVYRCDHDSRETMNEIKSTIERLQIEFQENYPEKSKMASTSEDLQQVDLVNIEHTLDILDKEITKHELKLAYGINIYNATKWPDNLNFSAISITKANIHNLITKTIDDNEVPNLNELVPLNNRNETIHLNKKHFENIFIKDVTIKKLGDSTLNSYITLNKNHSIHYPMTFKDLTTPRVTVSGLIGLRNVTKEHVLLKTHKQNFAGTFNCKRCTVNNLETKYINGLDIYNLPKQEELENETIIKGNVKFNGDLTIPGNLKVGSLMTLDISKWADNVLLQNSTEPQIITGKYDFKNVHIKKLQADTVNGEIFEDTVFINSPDRFYTVPYVLLDDLEADTVTVLNYLNGIEVSDEGLNVLTIKDPQTFLGKKTFHQIHIGQGITQNPPHINISSNQPQKLHDIYNQISNTELILNKFETLRILLKYIKKNKYRSTLQVHNNFLRNFLEKLIWIKENLDNETVIQNEFHLDDFQGVYESILLEGSMHPPKKYLIELYSLVDELLIVLDLKLKDIYATKETITNQYKNIRKNILRYPGTHNSTGSLIMGLINNVKLENLEMFSTSDEYTFNQLRNSPEVILEGNLNTQIINGVDIKHLLKDVIPVSSSYLNVSLRFMDNVDIYKGLNTEQINDWNLTDFATTDGYNVFTKPMEIEKLNLHGSIELKGTLNSISLREKADQIARIDIPNTFSHPIFFNHLKTNVLSCENVFLGDYNLENLVRTNEDAIIYGKKEFPKFQVLDTVEASNLTVMKWNNHNMSNILPKTIYGDFQENQLNLETILIKGNLQIEDKLMFDEKSENFNRLLKESFTTTDNITIDGSVIITGKANVDNLQYKDTLNGISTKQFNNELLLTIDDQMIESAMVFQNLHIQNLNVTTGNLGRLNIDDFINKTIKVDENRVIPYPVFFNYILADSVTVDGLVQNLNLSTDVIWNEEPVIFTGLKYFTGPVHISDRITVSNTINNIEVEEMCKRVLGTLIVEGSVHFSQGLIAEIVATDDVIIPTNSDVYWTVNKPAIFTHPVYFDNLITKKLKINKRLNGIPIDQLTRPFIRRDCGYPIKEDFTIESLDCRDLIIKNVNIQSINGQKLDFLSNILLNNTDQVFTKNLSISHLEIGRLHMANTVNGFHISDFCLTTQPCLITGIKNFSGRFRVENFDILRNGKINGISVQILEDLIQNPLVENVTIKESINAPIIKVHGFLNNKQFNSETKLMKSKNQHFPYNLTIYNPGGISLYVDDIYVKNGILDGINITELEYEGSYPDIFEVNVHGEPVVLEKFIDNITRDVLQATKKLQGQKVTFTGWEKVSAFNDGVKKFSVLSVNPSSSYHIGAIYNDSIQLYQFQDGELNSEDSKIVLDCSIDAKLLAADKHEFLITASSSTLPANTIKIYPEYMQTTEEFTLIWKISSGKLKLFAAVASLRVSEILILNGNCFMILNEYSTTQSIFCVNQGAFYLQQTFQIERVTQAEALIITTGSYRMELLIIADHTDSITISFYDRIQEKYLVLEKIELTRLARISSTQYNGTGYLATITPFCASNLGEIRIFRLHPTSHYNVNVELEDVIPVENPLDVKFLEFPSNELVMIVLTDSGKVYRYAKTVDTRFTKHGTLHHNAKSIGAWNIGNIPYISITPGTDCWNTSAIIFKGKFRGWFEI